MKSSQPAENIRNESATGKNPEMPKPRSSSIAAPRREAAILRRSRERLKSSPTAAESDVRATLI